MSILNSVFVHSSVFETSLGSGNHLGVVINSDSSFWSFLSMQEFARFTNLVETTFVEITGVNEYNIRIFTPHVEIPFAAHPTIGTAHVLLSKGLITPIDGIVYQNCKIGKITIRIRDGNILQLKSPKAQVGSVGFDNDGLLLKILKNVNSKTPVLMCGGRNWWIVEIENESMLRNWIPDHFLIKELALQTNSVGICAFCLSEDHRDDFDIIVRAFASGVGIIEDPASGAANGLLGSYLNERPFKNVLETPILKNYIVSQGREIGFDAKIYVDFEEETKDVWVGGKSNIIIDGNVRWIKKD